LGLTGGVGEEDGFQILSFVGLDLSTGICLF